MSALKNISLRRFRDDIVNIREVVEVSRRDPEGNIQLLGVWTPYSPEGAEPLSRRDGDEDPPHVLVLPGDQLDLRTTRGPHVIRTPAEARETATSIRARVRPFTKEVQTGRKRR